jgi:hypothetical protein
MKEEQTRRSGPTAEDYSPRQYSFRTSAAITVKLLAIGGAVLALLWTLDTFLAP